MQLIYEHNDRSMVQIIADLLANTFLIAIFIEMLLVSIFSFIDAVAFHSFLKQVTIFALWLNKIRKWNENFIIRKFAYIFNPSFGWQRIDGFACFGSSSNDNEETSIEFYLSYAVTANMLCHFMRKKLFVTASKPKINAKAE